MWKSEETPHNLPAKDQFAPNEKHWQGSTTTAMTHIATQEALDGKIVEWIGKVNDE